MEVLDHRTLLVIRQATQWATRPSSLLEITLGLFLCFKALFKANLGLSIPLLTGNQKLALVSHSFVNFVRLTVLDCSLPFVFFTQRSCELSLLICHRVCLFSSNTSPVCCQVNTQDNFVGDKLEADHPYSRRNSIIPLLR